jgi:hypothetical protein
MEKTNFNLNNFLARVSEENFDLAAENTVDAKNGQASWGWSAAENKSWSNQSWSWSK